MTALERLPLGKQVAYALGQLGWSLLINIVSLTLVYFYIPPEGAGLPLFLPQVSFLIVLNTVTLLAASGRLLDAITDPLIASWSDRWQGSNGRRMPFLKAGALPAAVCCVLMFMPVFEGVSGWNVVWVGGMQLGFFVALTVYVTPYFALLPELGHTSTERLNLSTWISITYALGLMLAAQVPLLAGRLEAAFAWTPVHGVQAAIALLAAVAVLLMWVPTWFIDEQRYVRPASSEAIPMRQALQHTWRNPYFRYYVVADFAYFMGLTMVMTGMLYYITVLLGLDGAMASALLVLMVVVSFVFYPLVNLLARLVGKKPLVVGAFAWMAVTLAGIFFLGRLPLAAETQGYLLTFALAVPVSFLGILPNAILADIADADARVTGKRQEGMFFAARTLLQKFGVTGGVLVFAALTSLGKDPGDDLGLRLSGLLGAALCLLASVYFLRYQEQRLLAAASQAT